MSSQRQQLQQRVAMLIASGFYSAEDVLELVEDEIEELGAPPVWRRQLAKLAQDHEHALHEREQGWKEFTVNDRINAAFRELDGGRIVARQNAGYTLSEGWEDVAEYRARGGRGQLGAVFYHGQDLERGVAGEGLMLAFGSFEPDDAEGDAAVAREVIEVFAKHGIELEWNGDVGTRLRVPPFPWQRRRTSSPPGRAVLVHACSLEHRVAVLKTCKRVLGMTLADARAGLATLEGASYRWDRPKPWIVVRGVPLADARRYVEALQEAGAEASLG